MSCRRERCGFLPIGAGRCVNPTEVEPNIARFSHVRVEVEKEKSKCLREIPNSTDDRSKQPACCFGVLGAHRQKTCSFRAIGTSAPMLSPAFQMFGMDVYAVMEVYALGYVVGWRRALEETSSKAVNTLIAAFVWPVHTKPCCLEC